MKPIKWVICCAAMMASFSATYVNAQVDDLFGTPGVGENRNPEPGNPTPTPESDDLFGAPIAVDQNAPARVNERSLRAPAESPEPDPFGPSVATVQAPTPTIKSHSRHNFCKCEGDVNLDAIAKIENALSSPLRSPGLNFTDTTLEEVIATLERDCGVPIEIDTAALDDRGIGPDEPVTISLHNVTLQSALRLILRQLQLTYVIENEVLLITTPEEADSQIKVCVYDVRDLIDGNGQAALSDLTNVIISCIKAEKWEANDGKGSIRSYSPNLLVIAQTQAVHEQIRNLLETMRQMRQASPVDGKPLAPARP